MQVEKRETAFKKVINYVKRAGSNVTEYKDFHGGIYKILKTSKGNFLVMYKTSFVEPTEEEFKKHKQSGYRLTVPVNLLKRATGIYNAERIIFVFSSSMYSLKIETLLLVNYKIDNGKTYSIPTKYLRRIDG